MLCCDLWLPIFSILFVSSKLDDDDNLPFMEALEISKNYNVHQSTSDHFGSKEDEDIPDKVECEEPNLIEANPVSYYW